MPVQSTLTLSDDLHTTVKMMAAARRTSMGNLTAELVLRGVGQMLREDPELADLVRSVIEREVGMDEDLQRDVLRLIDEALRSG